MSRAMVNQQDSRALIVAVQSGDRQAFEKLVSQQGNRIRALVASRLGSRIALEVDSDDVYQETLLRTYKSIASFQWRGEGSFLRWVGGIAEKVILDLARKKARARVTSLEQAVPAEGVSPSRAMRREERLERLENSLEMLSAEHRQIVLLTRVQRLSFDEAAERMGRSPDAVKQLLYRALKRLKASFGDTESLHLPGRPLKGEKGDDDERYT